MNYQSFAAEVTNLLLFTILPLCPIETGVRVPGPD